MVKNATIVVEKATMKKANFHKWDAVEIEWVDALHTIFEGWTEQKDIDFENLRKESKSFITRGTFLKQDDLNVYVCQTHSHTDKQVLGGMAIPKGTILSIKNLSTYKPK